MNRTLFLVFSAITVLAILVESGVMNSLVLFVLVGAVPGTSYSIPSSIMLLVMVTVMWLIVLRLAATETLALITTKQTAKRQTERKKRMPRRRFSQIQPS